MTLPTIHMNGTSKRMLLEGYDDAQFAIRQAQEAIGKIEFNARDYYPQGPEAWTQAVQERSEMMHKLADVMDYLLKHIEHIHDQPKI